MPAPAWWSDPAVRFNLRRSVFDLRVLAFWFALVIIVTVRARDRAAWFAIVFVIGGVVMASVKLLEMQSDGRLDQIRLAGRPPRAILMSFLLTSAGPAALMGLGILGWTHQTGGAAQPVVETAAIAGALLAGIAGVTRAGLSQQAVDPRIVIAGLVVTTVAIGTLGESGIAALTRARAPAAPFLLVLEAGLIAWFTSGIVRQVAYPPSNAAKSVWGLRLPLKPWMLQWPGIYRGAKLALNGLVLVLVFAPIIVAGRLIFAPPPQSIEPAALYLIPLLIGFITVSLLCREDLVSGRLELIRQSSTTPMRTALELLIGLWAPFLITAALLAVVAWAMFGVTRFGLVLGTVLLAVGAPLPVVEGWSRLWTLSYLVPYLVAFGLGGRSWPVILTLAVLNWWAVPRRFTHPDRPVLTGWYAVAATAGISAAAAMVPARVGPQMLGIALIPVMIAISPLLIDARRGESPQRWATPFAIAAAIAAVLVPRHGLAVTVPIAVLAMAAWTAAFRIVALLPAQPVTQASVRVVLVMLLIMGIVIADTAGYADLNDGWVLIALAIALCAVTELMARAAGRLGRPRIRPVTLRA